LAGRETDVAQRALQILGLDVLVALDLEALDRRSLENGDDERAAIAPQLAVAEEAGRIQRAQRCGEAPGIELVADVDRQVVVDGALGNALQALDADVADREPAAALRHGGHRNGAGCSAGRDRERRVNDCSETHRVSKPSVYVPGDIVIK